MTNANANNKQTKFDHEQLVKELEQFSDKHFHEILKRYDTYLKNNHKDVYVQIEKCKFLEFAQYDSYDNYNPNQSLFDSCTEQLLLNFPDEPEVLLYQMSIKWGDERDEVFDLIKESIHQHNEIWNDQQKAAYQFEKAKACYHSDLYDEAHTYALHATNRDSTYKTELIFIRILLANDDLSRAKEFLIEYTDTTLGLWDLKQRANLFIELEEYNQAMYFYDFISQKDSTFNNNNELAHTFEKLEQYAQARKYWVADTSANWNKDEAHFALLQHDLQYQTSKEVDQSYNAYRDLGFYTDPLGLYRIKILFKHPLMGWAFRDLGGLLYLAFICLILISLPSIWVLPVYVIGHRWQLYRPNSSDHSSWSIKQYWSVSAAYLLALFVSICIDPEIIYSWINWVDYQEEITQAQEAYSTLVFFLMVSIIGALHLTKNKVSDLFQQHDTNLNKHIGNAFILLIGLKFVFYLYKILVIKGIGIDPADFQLISYPFSAAREDILGLFKVYGSGVGILIVAFLIPIVEEIIFRGLILKSTSKYLRFTGANILQAFFFACVHFSLILFPFYFVFGILCGNFYRKSNSLIPAIIFHIFNNLLAAGALMYLY